MNAIPATRRLSVPQVIGGLLFRPAATMWKVRDEGPLWLSLVSAGVLGGLGLSQAVFVMMVDRLDYRFWLYWLRGIGILAAQFLGTMLLIHFAAVVIWRGGFDAKARANDQSPPMPAGMRTLLHLGGYWYLPSGLLSLTLTGAVLLAVRSGSSVAVKAAVVGIVPLYIAGWIWIAIFRLRIVRTVYLGTWGQAIVIGVIVTLLGSMAAGVYRQGPPAPDVAIASVDWGIYRALGANPAVIEALESIPQAYSRLRVMHLPGLPQPGGLVAFYRDREALPIRKGILLPKPIAIGRVVAGPGGEGSVEGSAPVQVPEGYALILPVGTIEGLVPELIPLKSVAGLVPESDLELMVLVTRLLLR
ncbi:MAG: hypothetical protein Q8P31_06020 [Bacillota bacterium]|nr:hypothetical protein [Bacillota bacterium]